MIKLLTLDNVSAFSSDSIFKICLNLDRFGMNDDKVFSFPNYNELFNSAETSLANGDFVIIATENSDLLKAKHMLSSRFAIDEESSSVIAEAISLSKASVRETVDMQEQCTVLKDSKIHLSGDGLYSAMSVPCSNGICTLIPLDFERLDSILEDYVSSFLAKKEAAQEESYFRPVENLVKNLYEADKTTAIATSNAAMNIYNLYDRIEHFTNALQFVDIVDEHKVESVNKNQAEEKPFKETSEEDYESLLADLSKENEEENPILDENAEETLEKEENAEEVKEETMSEKTARRAAEARNSMKADFGAAISDLCEEVSEDGAVRYIAYVAVSDEKSTKTKVVSTSQKEETVLLMDYTATVLAETIAQKLELPLKTESTKESDKSVLFGFSKNMIIFAAAVLVAAIVFPMSLAKIMYSGANNTPTLPDIVTGDSVSVNQVDLPISDPLFSVTQAQTTTNPFGLPGGADSSTLESGYTPNEPPATEVSAIVTNAPTTSTSGIFTFYVFGYGHGAGLSQTGANYLAQQGWNYAQILANYFYGTTLVSGDTYPETIKYNGQDYKTRDFLAGVLEAEMGGSFLPEALKAQTVAAYTFAKYYAFDMNTDKMAYEPNASKVCYDAVDTIMEKGVYITYNGTTALTPFFATSAGKTTSYYNVWGQYDLPYLQGGRPSYGDYNAPNFKQVKTYTSADLKALIQSRDSSIMLSGDPSTWISIISHDTAVNNDIGYVSSVNVGGKIMSGNDFRSKIMGGDLNSHCFMVSYTPDK